MPLRSAAAILAANSLWLTFAVAFPAVAQDYAPPAAAYGPGAHEQVIVNAPRFHIDHARLNAPLENVSLSMPVPYGDLDLRTREGAHLFRQRLREAATAVCGQLIEMYPVGLESDRQCFRDAVADSMARADAAIQEARSYPPGPYDRGTYFGGY